jgi:hypothetical protein
MGEIGVDAQANRRATSLMALAGLHKWPEPASAARSSDQAGMLRGIDVFHRILLLERYMILMILTEDK